MILDTIARYRTRQHQRISVRRKVSQTERLRLFAPSEA